MTIIENPPTIIGDATVGYYKVCDPPKPISYATLEELYVRHRQEFPPTIVKPTTEQIINTLDRTRRIIRRGWTQGVFYRDGKRCLLGALKYAIYGTHDTDRINAGMTRDQARLHRECLRVLATALHPNLTTEWRMTDFPSMRYAEVIYCWNDRPGRTKREVYGMLRTLIKTLR